MRAIAYALLQETLGRRYGGEIWEGLRASARTNGDGQDLPSDALACWLGREAVRLTVATHPTLFTHRSGARAFLEALAAGAPTGGLLLADTEGQPLDVVTDPDGNMLLAVQPAAGPCAFLSGVVQAVAVHYGERASVRSLKCVRHGDNRCVLDVSFGPPAAVGTEPGGARLRRA